MRRDDDDDRAGGESWIEHVVIPDDISQLDAEVRALHRERRATARRARLRRLVSPRGAVGALIIVALLMVAGLASLLMLFQPRRTTTSPAPLASSGAGSGANGKLLPDLPVKQADGTTRRLRDFRPAVLALAPTGCGCDRQLRDIGSAVVGDDLSFVLVDRTLPALPVGLAEPATIRLSEPTGVLAEKYGAEVAGLRTPGGPVLVLVARDGRVARTVAEPFSASKLKTELDVLRLGLGAHAPTG